MISEEKHIGRNISDKKGPIAEKYISEEIIDENVPTNENNFIIVVSIIDICKQ